MGSELVLLGELVISLGHAKPLSPTHKHGHILFHLTVHDPSMAVKALISFQTWLRV